MECQLVRCRSGSAEVRRCSALVAKWKWSKHPEKCSAAPQPGQLLVTPNAETEGRVQPLHPQHHLTLLTLQHQ